MGLTGQRSLEASRPAEKSFDPLANCAIQSEGSICPGFESSPTHFAIINPSGWLAAMTGDDEYNDRPHVQNEQQRGWAHVPSNDHHDIVSPIFSFSPTSTTASDGTKAQQQPQPYGLVDTSAMPSKGIWDPYQQEIFEIQPQKKKGILSEWWQEILSAISSILCTVAIVVILYNVDGKPLSKWTVPISLNVVISILSTAGKAGLILPVAECISQLKWIHLQSKKSQ